jgi:signal transduction histidine kinase
MKRHPTLQFGDSLPALALSALEARNEAAWLIDVHGGYILATNGEGAALLGLLADQPRPVLDAAMPALVRLRALAAGAEPAGLERLVLWTRHGALTLCCTVSLAESKGRSGPIALVAAKAKREPADAAAVSASAPAPQLVGDDAMKLREIARRIRDGQKKAAADRTKGGAETGSRAARASDQPTPPEAPVPPSLRSRLAHELKTPMSAIVAAAEIMKDQRFGPLGTPRYLGYAMDIHASAQHALSVIERMLGDGSAAAPEQPTTLEFTELDAGEVLKTSVSQVMPLANQAGISLALDVAPRLPHIIADATSLRQIVLNLLTNSLKFTDRGGSVTVAARYSLDGPLAIEVRDTGHGMTQHEIAQSLAPYGGASGVRREGGGLGIGLPLVRALAEANGAQLLIASTPGEGTCASVVFGRDRVVPV